MTSSLLLLLAAQANLHGTRFEASWAAYERRRLGDTLLAPLPRGWLAQNDASGRLVFVNVRQGKVYTETPAMRELRPALRDEKAAALRRLKIEILDPIGEAAAALQDTVAAAAAFAEARLRAARASAAAEAASTA